MFNRIGSVTYAFLSSAARAIPAHKRAEIAWRVQHLGQLRHRLRRRYRANRQELASLRNAHIGETCVILGNGPSMRDFDLSRLSGVACFSLNRGYLMWDDQGLKPDYVVAVNDLVLDQFANDIARSGNKRFVPWDSSWRFSSSNDNIFLEMLWQPRFHADLRDGIWAGGTVTFAAMQIAYHLGFRRVVLLGVDHRFAFTGRSNEKLRSTGPDVNHFSPTYFGEGVSWNAPDLARSEVAYAMARQAFEHDGREILDATEGGQLQVFRKCGLAEALSG